MSTPLIEAVNLKKYFNVQKGVLHAVDDVSFKIKKGETLGVVGESGCGKSTLGRTIMRLIEATDGKVLFNGENIFDKNKKQMKILRTKMQMIFQDPFTSLNPRLTISDIIDEPIKVTGIIKDKSERKSRIMELMERCGIPQRYINTYPHELDGGRRQRVGIARALAVNPDFLVCDEPVSALDVSIQAQILNLLMDMQDEQGLTYMFITHNLCVVRHISDNIMVMYMGKVVEYASCTELFQHPLHPYTVALLSAIPTTDLSKPRRRELIKGEVANPINPAPGCRFAPRCPYATAVCKEPQQMREVSDGHFVACHLNH